MFVVTGGAGFIGSNLVHALGARGADVVVVDDLTEGRKFQNLVTTRVADYLDKDEFAALLARRDGWLDRVEGVLHEGACSSTTEWNGRYVLENNFTYSKRVYEYCTAARVPFVYASSAAVYGAGRAFRESPECECPRNVYGYSKLLFDCWVRDRIADATSPVVGLRYFNVYGPREAHKGAMASIILQLYQQVRDSGLARLFAGSDGFADGEQLRDFVHVDDVVAVNLWVLDHPSCSGLVNVGTGRARSFNDVARAVIAASQRGEIKYVPFPESLRGAYQSHTEADLSRLRAAGYQAPFMALEDGVRSYVAWLEHASGPPHA